MKAHTIYTLAAAAVLMTSCGRDTVKVYHVDATDAVATPEPPATPVPSAMPATMPAGLPAPDNSGLPPLKYTLPAGWKEKPLTQMRVASFDASENGRQADVSVIPLSGMAGGDVANVNRWRGQVGLPPLAAGELQKLAEPIEVAAQPVNLYDVTGTTTGSGDAERIVGMVLHRDETTWFFKMTGDPDLVEKQKPAFISLLKTLEFGSPAGTPAMYPTQLPPSHPAIAGMNLAAPAAMPGDKPVWILPAGWQEGVLAQFLVAKYLINGADGAKAEVNVSSLDGDGGGLLPNVNRWRAQLGLPPLAAENLASLPAIDAGGAKATVVEFAGTNSRTGQPASLVGVVLPLGGQTWFYKLMGDAPIVAQQKDAFLKFIQSAKYPDAH